MQITLNLMPPEKKRGLQTGQIVAYAQSMTVLFALSILLVSATIFSVWLMLKADHDGLRKLSESSKSSESTMAVKQITTINEFVKGIDKITSKDDTWTSKALKVSGLVPPGVQLRRLRIDQGGRVTIAGIAATREDALSLLRRMREAPFLDDVVSPLSNILQKRDVTFEIEAKYVSTKAN